MHTNWCVLIEISMEIGMLNFWLPLLVTALTKENYFIRRLILLIFDPSPLKNADVLNGWSLMYNTFTVHFLYYFFYGSDPTARCTMVKDWRNSALHLDTFLWGFSWSSFQSHLSWHHYILTLLQESLTLIWFFIKTSCRWNLSWLRSANLNMNFKDLLRRVFN